MQYEIMHSVGMARLEQLVTERLKEGWKLQGGVAVSVYVEDGFDESHDFYQAMTRNEE